MIDYTAILSRRYKDDQWTLNGDDYEGLTWLSDSIKPTKKELDALWTDVEAEMQAEKVAKEQNKINAQNKLAALGLTADELKALGIG